MAETPEKKFITTFCEAWGEVAAPLLGDSTELGLLALREVQGEGVEAALAVAATWSLGFLTTCSGALPGILLCLFKSEDGQELASLMKQAVGVGDSHALLKGVLQDAAQRFAAGGNGALTLSEVTQKDLSGQESRLTASVGNKAWVGTFSLTIGKALDTQAIMLYAPNGSLAPLLNKTPEAVAPPVPATAPVAPSPAPPASNAPSYSRRNARVEDPAARNLERLLGVELEVIVRFGTTSMPLRDVVRLGAGMMIELNRAVDEPVELLVNGHPLARGEVVVVDGYYGVRITEIGSPPDVPLSLIVPGGNL
jgi:flagellar motor switch protein FliN